MVDAASVIFFVFLIGGAFTVVDRTGALREAVEWLVRRLARRDALVIPAACLAFALGGVLDNMKEEIIALVPVMLLLVGRLGFDTVTAVAASLGAAAVGAAFSPINPFQVGIAQQLAQLPLLSGSLFRSAALCVALAIWTWGTMRYATRTRVAPEAGSGPPRGPPPSRGTVLVVVLAAFAGLVVGVLRYRWGFDEMAALFFVMGVVAGLCGGLGVGGTAVALVDGFRAMAYEALLCGLARAIYVALDQGRIVDTIVRAVHACRGPAPRALRPGHVAAARRRPRRRAQPQRPRRADAAHPRPPVRPAGPVASGDGARLPVRRWAVRTADADQRRAHGDPGRGGRALRALAQIRVAAVRPAPRAGCGRDRPWHRGGPALASGRVSCARESWSWHV